MPPGHHTFITYNGTKTAASLSMDIGIKALYAPPWGPPSARSPTPLAQSFWAHYLIFTPLFTQQPTSRKWSLNLSLPSMPREASAKSDFRKSYKSPVGAAINQFQSAGRWDKNSGILTTGKLIGRKKQKEWQDNINSRSQALLDGTCVLCMYHTI